VGYYYAFVALPIFQFLMYRWAYRMVVFTRFLWQVSKLDLLLTPTHPDGAGGLGFLGKGAIPFGVVLFALSSVVSAAIASRILFSGATLEQFEFIYATLIVLALIVFAGPLMVFTPKLFRLQQDGDAGKRSWCGGGNGMPCGYSAGGTKCANRPLSNRQIPPAAAFDELYASHGCVSGRTWLQRQIVIQSGTKK